jgi:glycosyltransferase involved in cell wall biosynthesis
MPLLSVITPTQAHNADWLTATGASVLGARLPAGWTLEWLVQEDGCAPSLAEQVRAATGGDTRVRYDALAVQAGSGATRNAALERARGDLVLGMDHDDVATPDGPAALVTALVGVPDAAWACGRCDWLLPDGGRWIKDDVLPPGRVEPGVVTAYLLATGDWPFPAAFTCYRREVLVAAGGWPAMVRSDDAGLLLGLAHAHPGAWVDAIVATYRRWPGQKTVRPSDIALRAVTARALRARAEALQRLSQ